MFTRKGSKPKERLLSEEREKGGGSAPPLGCLCVSGELRQNWIRRKSESDLLLKKTEILRRIEVPKDR